MFRNSESQTIYVRSQDRLLASDQPGNFSYEISLDDPAYDSVCLKSCSIPKSWYVFYAPYNTFTLVEAGVNYNITIPEGNYSIRSLMNALNTLLTNATTSSYTYVCDVNPSNEVQDGKFLFSVAGNAGIQPSFVFGADSPHLQLGFNQSTTYAFTADLLKSPNVIYLQQTSSLLLISDIVKQSNGDWPILQSLFVASPDFSSITYLCPDIAGYSKALNYHDSVYRFTLTDREGRVINLNGLNWSFTLVFFKRNDTDELFKKMLLLKNYEKLSKAGNTHPK